MTTQPVAVPAVKVETYDPSPAPAASEVLMPSISDSTPAVENKVEAAPVETPVKESVDVSAVRFAELTRRAKEQYRKEQELKQLEEKLNPVNEALTKVKENPLALLDAAGITFEDLTDFILNEANQQTNTSKELTVEEKVEQLELKLKAEEEAKQRQRLEEEQAQIESSIKSFNDTVKELAQQPEFELIHTTEQHEMVYDLVLAHYEQSGQVLPVLEAMQLVEAHLLEELESKALKANKIRQRLMVESQPKPQVTPQVQKPVAPKVTLSNSMAPSTSAQPSNKFSPEEAKARAVAMLKFQ